MHLIIFVRYSLLDKGISVRYAMLKVKLTFILCFGSNSNAFYLYRATSAAYSSTHYSVHSQL